jgi:WD40 repeat protein
MDQGDLVDGSIHHSICSFDQSFERFAAVSVDNRLKIWDVATGQLRHHFAQPTHLSATYTCMAWGQVATVAKSGKGGSGKMLRDLIALGTAQGDVVVWDVAKGDVVLRFLSKDEGEGGLRVNDVCFDSKCSTLFSCGDGSSILQWSTTDISGSASSSSSSSASSSSSGKAIRRLKAEKRGVFKLQITCDDSLLISAGRTHIKVWDLSSGRVLSKFPSHTTVPRSLSLSSFAPPQQPTLLASSAADDRFVNLWPFAQAVSSASRDSEFQALAPLHTLPCATPPLFVTINNTRASSSVASDSTKRGKKRKADDLDADKPADAAESAGETQQRFHMLALQHSHLAVFDVQSSGKLVSSAKAKASSSKSKAASSSSTNNDTTTVLSNLTTTTTEEAPFLHANFKGPNSLVIVRGTLLKPHFQTLVCVNKLAN